MLPGARLTDPKDADAVDANMIEAWIKVGVPLAAPNNGGDSLTAVARETCSALNPDLSHMTIRTPGLAGDADDTAHLTAHGADWYRDPFRDGPGADTMPILVDGKHGLGGNIGCDAKEVDDEDPDRLSVLQRMT